ncbi:MAG: hypothetical protein JJ868_17650 [Shimia sp.]|uniref:hypothetical protein n=1 Tax=Shimia sp. TaxID=1954381 RepID=UPI001B0C2E57|nr:hypothetical protein [Shimia sp.]MBO6899197.1 hypothetical protein [Shimia sp.]
MSAKHNIPFLERQSYRRRRLIDTIRMLPVIGAVLWAVPLLWRQSEDSGTVLTSDAIIYIFLVWLLLVVGGGWLAHSLKRSNAEERERGR